MSAEQQAASLLNVVESYRDTRCSEALNAAHAEAQRTIAQAHQAARKRLRAALEHERERLRALVAAAQARLATQRRLHNQRRIAAALKLAWAKLDSELNKRWDGRAARDEWVAQQLTAANATLPSGEWELQHPPQWDGAERERATQWLATHGMDRVRFVAQPEIRAGIRVRAGHNVLDATIAGLLADRTAIEGELLRYIEGGGL